jgi:hypothetical protein
MGDEYHVWGRRAKHTGCWWDPKERNCLGELGIGRRRILGWILKEIVREAKTWIHVAHDMAKCQAVVNMLRNILAA